MASNIEYMETYKQFGPLEMGYNSNSTLVTVELDPDRVNLIDVDEALDMIVFLSMFIRDAIEVQHNNGY